MEARQRRLVWVALGCGVFHGLLTRLVFGLNLWKAGNAALFPYFIAYEVMTGAFIFGAPLTMGFLSVWIAEAAGPVSWGRRLFLPWGSSLLALLAALLLGWEGWICVIMLVPAMLVLSTVGGLTAVGIRRLLGKRSLLPCAVLAAGFPYAAAPLEELKARTWEVREVRNQVEVRAEANRVWREIRSVPRIAESEQRGSWMHRMGFPRPLEAVLEGEGVGSVRMARFERGLVFAERVTEWDEPRRLAFTIRADTANIPPATLDEHVTIGGPYFDVLSGLYEVEPLAEGWVRLHLSSQHRLSTRFNWYASLWTEWVMSELQSSILEIVKRRAESGP